MLHPGSRLTLSAPAKLNLALQVLGKRSDGYHELQTVMHTIDLCDDVELQLVERATAEPRVSLEASGPETDASLPLDERNLAVAAALAYLSATDASASLGVHIALHKRIPIQGGLGGGSSDAAAVLAGLSQLDDNPPEDATLHALAARLGSDLNVFLLGGCVLALGRGERVHPLPDPPPFELTLALPDYGIRTPSVFAALDVAPLDPASLRPDDELCGSFTRLVQHASATELELQFRNDLELAARRAEPRVGAWLDDGWHLCGSGSTLFRFGSHTSTPPAACESKSIRFLNVHSRKR